MRWSSLTKMDEMTEAKQAVELNISSPSKDTCVAALLEVARLPFFRFAKHPKLRNTCLAKIITLRNHPVADEDVLDALELLRVTLWQSLDCDPWKEDERDEAFRNSVSSHNLVYGLESVEFDAEAVLAAYEEEDKND